MGQDNLNQIKNILGDYVSPIDNDALWAGIQAKQKASGRKRYFYLLLGLILFLIAAIGVVFIIKNANTNQFVEENLVIQKKIENQKNSHGNAIVNSKISKTKEATSNTNSVNTEANRSELTFTEENENKKNFENTVVTTRSKSKTGSTSEGKLNNNSSNYTAQSSNAAIDNSDINATRPLIENSTAILVQEEVSYPSLSHLNMLPLVSFSYDADRNLKSPRIDKRSNIECYDYGKKKIPVFLEVYSGLDAVRPSYNTSIENLDYLEERDATQTAKISFNAGAQLKFLFDNGLYIKAGVDYSQYRERFQYNKTTRTDTILPDQLIEINILPNGDTSWIYGNAPATIIESKNWRVGNDYREIGLTALAGYQVEKNNSFIGLETGIMYNLWFDFNGMLLNTSGNPIMVNDYFKPRNNLTILAGLRYGYRVTDRTAILAGLNYRSNLSDINSSNNLINQRNSRIGISVGIEQKLW